jgi:predicted 3-demethylubiquinone-9 3-methyltransferase (glyoxalase superfamily)
MQKITPFLWFDKNAEEAVNFYTSVFKNSKIETIARYGEEGPGESGSVMTAVFELFGQRFIALNGGPHFQFTPAISFVISCETQDEVDYYWDKLSEGGETNQCGWLTDKFGVTWQVVPSILGDLLSSDDEESSQRVMHAMLQMTKLDIQTLQDAAATGVTSPP